MLTSSAFAAAVALAAVAQPTTAIDYVGGWLPTPPKEQCVDICVGASPAPFCPTKDPACQAKLQRAGDFDYLLLEQIFVPQFCRDLLKGVDSTVSHQNVNPYPNGITCKPAVVKSELTIHGLWPNYDTGYAGCCNATESIGNKPFNAATFAKKYPDLLKEMDCKWVDPTQINSYDTLCEIYNHEFQKHGVCYNAFGDDWDKSAANYFKATLHAARRHNAATAKINHWATTTMTTTVAEIKKLYPNKIQVLCSTKDGPTKFSAIRSCFAKPDKASANPKLAPKDCADPTSGAIFVPCDETQPLTLSAYQAPAPQVAFA